MKRIMIVGASAGQIPLIKRAKELGYYVAVADMNTKAIGIPLADEFYNASTIDEAAVTEAAKAFHPDGITTMQTDMPMRAIAAVNEELGLCGINRATAIRATDKIEMIKCFKEHNVASPWFYVVDNDFEAVKEKLTYPCIIKPADSSASRGVCLVEKEEDAEASYEYSKSYSRGGRVIVEEYMKGPEVSVEILVWKGKPHVITVTDKITTGAPYFVEMGHNEPSSLPAKDITAIKKLAGSAVTAVGIENGEGHVEIILTKDGPKVVELGARLGGDFITSDLVPLSTGVDMLQATLDIACGEKPDMKIKFRKGSAIRFIKSEPGRITGIYGTEEAEKTAGVHRIEFFRQTGDTAVEVHNSLDRVGCVIAQGDDKEKAAEICEAAMNKIKVVVENV